MDIKAMVLEALDRAGGATYLLKQAKQKNPTAFLSLVGRCMPLQHEHSGTLTLEQLVSNSIGTDGRGPANSALAQV
jgi:hypothetical protein